jgi:hypothetical protein
VLCGSSGSKERRKLTRLHKDEDGGVLVSRKNLRFQDVSARPKVAIVRDLDQMVGDSRVLEVMQADDAAAGGSE